MQIETITVQKLVVRDLPSLDPLHIYMEDTGPGQGTLMLKCYDRSWSTGWNAMGKDRTVKAFVLACDDDYLINCLSPSLSATQFSADELFTLACRIVLGRRRPSLRPKGYEHEYDTFTRDEARQMYEDIEQIKGCSSVQELPSDVMFNLFGDEWWHVTDGTNEPNPQYRYMKRVINGLRQALRADIHERVVA